jgi:hypothetical protein
MRLGDNDGISFIFIVCCFCVCEDDSRVGARGGSKGKEDTLQQGGTGGISIESNFTLGNVTQLESISLRESRSFGGSLSRGWAYNLLSPALHMNYLSPLPTSTYDSYSTTMQLSLSLDL